MRRTGVAALVIALVVLAAACGDDTPPVGAITSASPGSESLAPSASASPAQRELGRTLARAVAAELQQDLSTPLTPRQVDCLVDQLVAHLDDDVLTGLASNAPESGSVSSEEGSVFANAFARCLPPDVASTLRARVTG